MTEKKRRFARKRRGTCESGLGIQEFSLGEAVCREQKSPSESSKPTSFSLILAVFMLVSAFWSPPTIALESSSELGSFLALEPSLGLEASLEFDSSLNPQFPVGFESSFRPRSPLELEFPLMLESPVKLESFLMLESGPALRLAAESYLSSVMREGSVAIHSPDSLLDSNCECLENDSVSHFPIRCPLAQPSSSCAVEADCLGRGSAAFVEKSRSAPCKADVPGAGPNWPHQHLGASSQNYSALAEGSENTEERSRPGAVLEMDAFEIEGRIQKPEAFYILPRSKLDLEGLEREQSFLPRIQKSLEKEPLQVD